MLHSSLNFRHTPSGGWKQPVFQMQVPVPEAPFQISGVDPEPPEKIHEKVRSCSGIAQGSQGQPGVPHPQHPPGIRNSGFVPATQ